MQKLTTQQMQRLTVDEFRAAGKLPLVVVLDNVRSQHNVGAVFRTADAFLLEGVYLCGICPTPETCPVEIHKTALGAEQTVAYTCYSDTMDAIRALHARGYYVYAIEQAEGSTRLQDVSLPPLDGADDSATANQNADVHGYAIVLGHEVFGVQQSVVDAADGCIEIPQYGTKHSLNVSVTAGIVMYTLAQQLRA